MKADSEKPAQNNIHWASKGKSAEIVRMTGSLTPGLCQVYASTSARQRWIQEILTKF